MALLTFFLLLAVFFPEASIMIKKNLLLAIALFGVFQNASSSPFRTAIRRIAIASPTIGTVFALFGEKGLIGGAEELSDVSLSGIRRRQDDICDSFVIITNNSNC